MNPLSLVNLPEKECDDCDSKYCLGFETGFNQCLSEIRKLNEGVEVGVDEEIIFELIKKREFFLARYDGQEIRKLAKALAQSIDKWLIRKEK